ncbi:calponin homology domain-containing protein DDB_G0272472 isoform X2 [Oncorhynchus keta]|uniref:calponin homology domain-containing protein DDB_G0272472 isoform X2 n=1 Tax=Oncorhynchus keta TaxID=8018 RepID=UPI00227BC578|nr:calponin homology domain-containing protein DDB_G0272472 isoform X2 [Oncorhynchus keta]
MSLSDQSQQWYPTSVQVTVLQARSLRIKGKNGTNDAYAIMQVAKDKFATSVAEKSVVPVWKEEATFELPLFHNGNTEKCTLHVHVMHRALVGSDKLLGHAVINLLELSEVKSRNKTEWHKLLDKAGKPDKDRGEVLVDIQFMKNNLTASMFDLSATDKPRSRLGKFKDKVRGKKKEGLSDSASAVVPSFTQVLTDSEGEGEGEGGADKEEKKKKNKLKSLFSSKSNLQRHGLSQSMSVLGPLPEKDSSLSGSPSGLNEDSSEGKNKFKFLTHKRTGSSDSKASQGSLSLGRSKIHAPLAEQSNLCINGSHLYTEHPHPRSARTGSTFSLASSGHGSMEDLRRAQGRKSSSTSMDSLTALKQPSPWAEGESSRAEEDEEEEDRVKMDEMKRKEEQERKKLEEERMRKEEQEKRRIGKEVERLRFEEEEKTRKEEQENRKRMEEEEKIRVEEESRMLEERKRRLKEEGEERVKKKEQEMIRLQEEQERWEEEERMRREEHERMKREDRLRKEDERKMREEERLKREKEERIKEEEERIRREQEEDMQRREERQRKMREEEERLRMEEEMREEEVRVKREQDRLREEERRVREEEERVRKAEEEDRLRAEMGIKRTEEEERIKRDRLRKEEEESKIRKQEERIRILEEEMLRKDEEQRKIREEEERIRRLEEEMLRKEEEERTIREEEERIRRFEEEMLRKDEEEREIREEEERIRRLEEERIRRVEEERLRKDEEERKIREEEERIRRFEEERLRKEEEERKIREEEERIRRFEEEMLRKEEAETMRLEEERGNEQERSDKEQKERFRVEEENMKTEELRQEEKRRNAQMEEEQRREEARAPLEEVEKQMEQYSEAKVTVCNNPFEEVSPTSSFDDSSSNNLFEENPMTTTGPISCRINKVSAVKPRPSSWGNPSKPAISSNPFLSSSSPELESSMDSPRGARENRDAIDPSANLMEKKDPAPVAPINQPWARKDNWSSKSHCATPTLAKTKPTKPPPPLRCQSSTALVGSGDDQGSVSGKDHSSVRQDKGPAPLPPDNQRWAHKDNWPSKSNPGSATPTLTQKTPTKPQPPPRRHSATSLVGSEHDLHLNESVSQGDSGVRGDKRPAPLPPDRPNQAPSQIQRDQSMASVNRGHKDRVDASMSKVSQRVVQMITPLRSSSTATTEHISGGQSSTHHGNQAEEPMPSATGGLVVAKHNKGPAPSRPQHLPGKTMPTPTVDVLDEQSNTEEHDSSVEFGPNNPFAEDCRMEKSSGCGVEQSLTGERQGSPDSHIQQSCTSTDADLGPFQKRVVGDTTELPTPDALPAEDVSCPTKSTSAKRARAPLPPVKMTSTFREEGAGKQSSGKLQSPEAPTSSKLSSGNWVKKQNGGVGVALPCVTLAQPPCFPSPAPSSIPHPEPLKGSGSRRDCPPQTTSSVPGQKTLLHAGALPSITEQNSGEEAGGRGDRSASSTRRPHPVKPLSSLENQPASNIHEGQAGKSTGILGGLQEKIKVKDTGVKGPYSQLTQEELISLVLKQQEQLSKRDDKIKELEQYIDNLLVRIIEEQPSILMTMNSLK